MKITIECKEVGPFTVDLHRPSGPFLAWFDTTKVLWRDDLFRLMKAEGILGGSTHLLVASDKAAAFGSGDPYVDECYELEEEDAKRFLKVPDYGQDRLRLAYEFLHAAYEAGWKNPTDPLPIALWDYDFLPTPAISAAVKPRTLSNSDMFWQIKFSDPQGNIHLLSFYSTEKGWGGLETFVRHHTWTGNGTSREPEPYWDRDYGQQAVWWVQELVRANKWKPEAEWCSSSWQRRLEAVLFMN